MSSENGCSLSTLLFIILVFSAWVVTWVLDVNSFICYTLFVLRCTFIVIINDVDADLFGFDK